MMTIQPSPAEPVQGEVLSARSIVKSYGNSLALRGVSISAARGDVLAITGPSGSGKSTLLLCLAGILIPDNGEVRFAGRRIDNESEAARSALRRHEFGVLFQFGQVVPELSAQENVALPLLLSGVGRRPAMTAARSWLDRFGVAELADQRPPQMSGGQAQRVALARAMVTEPEVLFADEPTGALDSLAGEQVLGHLTGVAREAGTTVLLVTHDAKVAAYADREIVIHDGLVVGDPGGTAGSGTAAMLGSTAESVDTGISVGQHRIHR